MLIMYLLKVQEWKWLHLFLTEVCICLFSIVGIVSCACSGSLGLWDPAGERQASRWAASTPSNCGTHFKIQPESREVQRRSCWHSGAVGGWGETTQTWERKSHFCHGEFKTPMPLLLDFRTPRRNSNTLRLQWCSSQMGLCQPSLMRSCWE